MSTIGEDGSMSDSRRLTAVADLSVTPVRLGMTLDEAEQVGQALLASRGSSWNRALRDLLWLQVTLIEQWRRTPMPERERFEQRADSILDRFWAGALLAVPSAPRHTVSHHERR